jgi:hypothetical protein
MRTRTDFTVHPRCTANSQKGFRTALFLSWPAEGAVAWPPIDRRAKLSRMLAGSPSLVNYANFEAVAAGGRALRW